jgi:hypothetical protein
MIEYISSFSVESGAWMIALVSGVLAIPLAFIKNSRLMWALIFGVPFLIAYSFYWTPVWFGNGSDEYSSWAGLFITIWFGAGASASLLICFSVKRLRYYFRKRTKA